MLNVPKCMKNIAPFLYQNRKNGKLWLAVILALYYIVFGILLLCCRTNIMKKVGVPVMSFPFADARGMTAGMDCVRMGKDCLYENICDPKGRVVNYPKIWMNLKYFKFITQSNTVALGVLLSICFYLSVLIFIPKRSGIIDAFIFLLVLLSPATLLAVDRGNTDLIVFILLVLALIFYSKNIAFYLIILFAAFLKLYPIFAIITVLKESKKNILLIVTSIGLLFGSYIIFSLDDLRRINSFIQVSYLYSYSIGVANSWLYQLPDWYHIGIIPRLNALTIGCFAFMLGLFKRPSLKAPRNNISAFRVGSSIYIGSFFLTFNWEYRLIFLIFTLPQLLEWIKAPSPLRRISIVSLISILIICWTSLLHVFNVPLLKIAAIKDIFCWILFACFITILTRTLCFDNKCDS